MDLLESIAQALLERETLDSKIVYTLSRGEELPPMPVVNGDGGGAGAPNGAPAGEPPGEPAGEPAAQSLPDLGSFKESDESRVEADDPEGAQPDAQDSVAKPVARLGQEEPGTDTSS